MERQVEHPQLGKIQGTASNGIVNFLGLKYATLANQFATAQLAGPPSETIADATKYGYGSTILLWARTFTQTFAARKQSHLQMPCIWSKPLSRKLFLSDSFRVYLMWIA